jgi:hypothetical protein
MLGTLVNGGQNPYRIWRRKKNWHGICGRFSRSSPSNAWWQTKAGWQALSRPSAAAGGGRRRAFTGLATQPYSATEVDGWLPLVRFVAMFCRDSHRRQQLCRIGSSGNSPRRPGGAADHAPMSLIGGSFHFAGGPKHLARNRSQCQRDSTGMCDDPWLLWPGQKVPERKSKMSYGVF